jgi:uncharacterized protein (DUF58 family)
MEQPSASILSQVEQSARFIARNGWVVALIGVPAALVFHSYGVLFFILLLVAFWQLLRAGVSLLVPEMDTGTRLRMRYRLTRWGLVYGCTTLLFYFLCVSWGLNLVYLTTSFLVAGLVCAAVFPGLVLSRTGTQWHLPEQVFAGKPFRFEVTLTNRKRLLTAFGMAVSSDAHGLPTQRSHNVPALCPGRQQTLVLEQHMPVRGRHRLPPVIIRSCYPFGMLEASVEAQRQEPALILPSLGHIRREEMLRLKGHEAQWLVEVLRKDSQGEFRSLREYQHGDNPHHIHWATSARLRKLHVREFETRETRGVLIMLDSHLPAGAPAETEARLEHYEKAVSFTATLASLLTAHGMDHAFASLCPDLTLMHYGCGAGHFHALLCALAAAQATPQAPLENLVAEVSSGQFAAGGVCLVTPGPLSAQQAASALGRLGHNAICIDVSSPEFNDVFDA